MIEVTHQFIRKLQVNKDQLYWLNTTQLESFKNFPVHTHPDLLFLVMISLTQFPQFAPNKAQANSHPKVTHQYNNLPVQQITV